MSQRSVTRSHEVLNENMTLFRRKHFSRSRAGVLKAIDTAQRFFLNAIVRAECFIERSILQILVAIDHENRIANDNARLSFHEKIQLTINTSDVSKTSNEI